MEIYQPSMLLMSSHALFEALEAAFYCRNVSILVESCLPGEPLPGAPILTSLDVKSANTSVPVTLSSKMPKTGNWLQVPNQGAAYAVVFRYMPSAQQVRICFHCHDVSSGSMMYIMIGSMI